MLRRSLGFHGLLVSTRAPRALMFSVTPSCAGVRGSTLERSTITSIGVRSSVRFKMGSMDTGIGRIHGTTEFQGMGD